jgi:hypothetical protein
MNRSQLLARCSAAAAAATIIAGLSAIPAAARPHPGESIVPQFDERNCLLSRIDTQLVVLSGGPMEKARSADGTTIAYDGWGSGPLGDGQLIWISPRGLPYRRWR